MPTPVAASAPVPPMVIPTQSQMPEDATAAAAQQRPVSETSVTDAFDAGDYYAKMKEDQRRRDQQYYAEAQAEDEQRRIDEEPEGLWRDGYHMDSNISQEAEEHCQFEVDQQLSLIHI
eukprot:3597615-Pyramimonas_sp.AAC.1